MAGKVEIGAALRSLRERRGLSLEQVARKIGMRKQGVAAIETGVSGASVVRLQEVAAAVGGEVHVLVTSSTGLDASFETLDPDAAALLLRIAKVLPLLAPADREREVRFLEARAGLRTIGEAAERQHDSGPGQSSHNIDERSELPRGERLRR